MGFHYRQSSNDTIPSILPQRELRKKLMICTDAWNNDNENDNKS